MMDFNERVIPGVSANFLYQEALARYKFAQKFVKPGIKILDVGCGTGYGSAILSEKAKVIGIDNNREAIEFAKKNYGKKITFKIGTAENLTIKNNAFETVLAFEVIEHLKYPQIALNEIKRVLKPEGKFILSTPNIKFQPHTRSPYHFQEYDYQKFLEILVGNFNKVTLFGQNKSKRAKEALADFMKSQKARQSLVNSDIFGIRKLLPKSLKEKVWKYTGSLVGRATQETLRTEDFPITRKDVNKAEYFIALCQK